MEVLKSNVIEKPKFVSDVTIKIRPEVQVISLHGKGDPMLSFDQTTVKIMEFLKGKTKPVGHTLGIYYTNRNIVGVKNVEWDSCVPVNEKVAISGDFKLQTLPSSKIASLVLNGSYDLIGPALKYLEAVTKTNNIPTTWPLTEIYFEGGPKFITELQYFITE